MFSPGGMSRLVRLVAEEASGTVADCVQRLSSPLHHTIHAASSLSSSSASSSSSTSSAAPSRSSSTSSDECFIMDDVGDEDDDEEGNKRGTRLVRALFSLATPPCEAGTREAGGKEAGAPGCEGAPGWSAVRAALDALPAADHDVLQLEDKDHYTLLQKAVILDHGDLFQALLAHGCDVNYSQTDTCNNSVKCSHRGLGLLHLACFLGRLDFVQQLIEHGADVHAKRRVYTSSLVNCPAHRQPAVLSSGSSSSAALELVHRCGERDPVFFAVLGDQRAVLHLLFSIIRPLQDPVYHSLLPLACRAGATRCLEYLIQVFPHAVDCADSDGLPPVLMAMKHGLAPVRMLLEHGARVAVLSDHWAPGNNILHFLFRSLPFADMDVESLLDVVQLCLEQEVAVGAVDEASQEMPLHILLRALNKLRGYDSRNISRIDRAACLTQLKIDRDIVQCIELLLSQPGVDVNVSDEEGRTLLHVVCSNSHHIMRYKVGTSSVLPPHVTDVISQRCYGFDNVVAVVRLILERGASPKADYGWSTPLNALLDTLSVYFSLTGVPHLPTLDILQHEDLFTNYTLLVRLLVARGNDINSGPSASLPPLLYAISRCERNGTLCTETAGAVCELVRELLELGAWTEYDSCYDGEQTGAKRHIGVFDVVLELLGVIENFPASVHTANLELVARFTRLLLHYGAKTVVYGKLLYGHGDEPGGGHPEPAICHHLPEHSFLYQLLQLGALNLHITGPHYWALCDLFLAEVGHGTYYEVLHALRVQFEAMHETDSCECGQCDQYAAYIADHSAAPRPLQHITRITILDAMTGHVTPANINSLPLPAALVKFLLYQK